ncbi:MAG TPA: hypothetical protein VEA69_19390 [Tepidisphaeraceae bacterium]|nr:hypothetical protein [Tepidisphaeraceae bacterium]
MTHETISLALAPGRSPSRRQQNALRLLLLGEAGRCSDAALRSCARRGWAVGQGGAYRLTAAGRALAESLGPMATTAGTRHPAAQPGRGAR